MRASDKKCVSGRTNAFSAGVDECTSRGVYPRSPVWAGPVRSSGLCLIDTRRAHSSTAMRPHSPSSPIQRFPGRAARKRRISFQLARLIYHRFGVVLMNRTVVFQWWGCVTCKGILKMKVPDIFSRTCITYGP